MQRRVLGVVTTIALGILMLMPIAIADAGGTDHPECANRIEISVGALTFTVPEGGPYEVWSKTGSNDHVYHGLLESGTVITSGVFNQNEQQEISHVDLCFTPVTTTTLDETTTTSTSETTTTTDLTTTTTTSIPETTTTEAVTTTSTTIVETTTTTQPVDTTTSTMAPVTTTSTVPRGTTTTIQDIPRIIPDDPGSTTSITTFATSTTMSQPVGPLPTTGVNVPMLLAWSIIVLFIGAVLVFLVTDGRRTEDE